MMMVNFVEVVDGINFYIFEDLSDEIQGSFLVIGGGMIVINFVFFDCWFFYNFVNGWVQLIFEMGMLIQDGIG